MESVNTTSTQTQNILSENDNSSEVKETVKNSLLAILIKSSYINDSNANKLNNINEVAKYMQNLVKIDVLSKDLYINICIQAGVIKLWKYLVYKKLITNENLELALNEQNNNQEFQNMNLWEILDQKKLIDFKDLALALEEFWVIKLWEYLISQNLISKGQLQMFMKVQKYEKVPLGKVLIKFEILTQEKLNEIFNKLWIQLTNSDFLTEEDEELDYYKLK